MNTIKVFFGFLFGISVMGNFAYAQNQSPLEGRWDMVVEKDGESLPSWLEVTHSGLHTLVGRFVYASGSARPISEIEVHGNNFVFVIPPQWTEGYDLVVQGELKGSGLEGTLLYADGSLSKWTAVRAPKLAHVKDPKWGKPIKLLNGRNLDGWHTDGDNQWEINNGVLESPRSGANLITDQKFEDFKLHIEFKYPKDSNSGIYLRGRYEVQVADNQGLDPESVYFSGIYGFLTPNENMAKAAGEWQAYDITLIGRRVTIVANGVPVIVEQDIPGITGGALDSREGEPGPIMIQGDHGPASYRNIVITPRVN